MQDHETCKYCHSRLIQKSTRQNAAQLKKAYYYTAYYFCPKCKRLYHNDKFKVVNSSLFDEKNTTAIEDTKNYGAGNIPAPAGDVIEDTKHSGVSLNEAQKKKQDSRFRGNDNDGGAIIGSYDVEIWTDGACVFNGRDNARAAWAFVSYSAAGETEKAGLVDGKQTNNVAEALAIYYALSWAAEQGYKKIKLYTDSQISLYNLKKPIEKVIANREIFEKIADLIDRSALSVHYEKVLGHSGDIHNERADRLANELAGGR